MRGVHLVAAILAFTWHIQGILAVKSSIAAQASVALDALKATAPFTTLPASDSTPDLATLKAAVLAGNYTPRASNLTRSRCPRSCSDAGVITDKWYSYHTVNRLALCNDTMLLDFSLFNSLDDPSTHISISACTVDLEPVKSVGSSGNTTCQLERVNQTEITSSLQLGSSGSSSSVNVQDAVAALEQLSAFFTIAGSSCNETINFAYSGKVAIGIYVGKGLTSQGVITPILQQLSNQLQSDGEIPETLFVQLCDSQSSRYSIGIFANTNADLSSAQIGVQAWKNHNCISNIETIIPSWQNITFLAPSLDNSVGNSSTAISTILRDRLNPRADCTTIQVAAGDSCASLASECGITPADFTIFNPSSTECSTLAVGEHVCCSAGTLPDFSPKPDADGNCASYLVVTGDSCSEIAATNSITIAQLESFNTNVWGWNGCADLLAQYVICLSTGFPPMPSVVENSVCGPQVPNTPVAPQGTDFATLNECPLNACCDIWGQCGTTTEFCTPSNSSTNAPGTAAPGQNGCISNCGTDILISSPPAETFSIGYFEGFDWQRPCMKMTVNEIDLTEYTHIHFSFATLNADFSVNVTSIEDQLPFFAALSGVKRVMTFGGWSFSTDPSTYDIFRESVSTVANMEVLVNNLVAFVNEWQLDGIDWDWEYPDEPDIPGIPAGTTADTAGYFLFLDLLKEAMPSGTTVSITAPASFWYLQHFPIQAIGEVVDYIVFMTYDLHGQWDYGNIFSDDGCPEGGCLRSHVNLTETINALSMITKAGVPSNKVAVGVTSYARSFKMSSAGCTEPECTFTGPLSGAIPGPCTDTAGYISDYELSLIVANDSSAMQLWDANSYSNILIYEQQTNWAGYMNDTNKLVRKALYSDLTFLGTADWAVDLQSADGTDSSSGSGSDSNNETIYIDPGIWSSASAIVTALPGVTLVWPPMPLPTTTTITIPLWTTFVSVSSVTSSTSTAADGSITTFPWLVWVTIDTVITVPQITTTAIPVWGVSLSEGLTGGPITLTSSVQPDPFAITVTPIFGGTTSILDPVTTTDAGTTVFWGSLEYIQPVETETDGQSTTVIGGITLAPTVITVTPPPHPTTTPTSKDNNLNSHGASWKSGSPPKPTNSRGCIGCGNACEIFCNSGCPWCPPWSFGHQGGSSSGNGDDDDDDSSSSASSGSSEMPTATFDWASLIDDEYPTAFPSLVVLESLLSLDIALGLFTSTNTIGTPGPSVIPSATPTRTPSSISSIPPATTPFISCTHQDADPDGGISSAFCVCSESTVAESLDTLVTPANSCAYTSLPGSVVSNPIQTIITTQTSDCLVCTFVGLSENCTPLAGCTTPTPTPTLIGTPTGVLSPSVLCTAIGSISNIKVYIWTNYITDTGAALEAAEDASCGAFGLSGFSAFGPVDGGDRTINNSDGTSWEANNMYEFTLNEITHPQALECISRGIEKGGGPTTGNCGFEPALEADFIELVLKVFTRVIEIVLDGIGE